MSLRRLYGLCAVLVLLAGVVLCRTYWVGQQTAYAASAGGQSVQTLTLPRARGDFYDRTGRRLTGLSPQYYALCLPGDAGYTALFPYVPYAEQSLLYERRNLASPFLIQVDRDLTAQGITTCTVPQHFGGSTAAHLLGYLDSEGRGVSGLEKAYDDLLTASGDARTVTCFMTAQGRLLTDTGPLVAVETPGTGQGVRLTLDADLQRACEGLATLYLPRGCLVVMDTATGEVLASMRGETVQALVEGVSRRRENQLTGKTGRNINVNFNGAPDDIGKMVRVRITGAGSNTLRGEKVEE